MEFLGRFGLLISAVALLWLAKRLHTKGRGKAQKNVATVGSFLSGLLLMGTFVGGWMADLTAASPYIAAATVVFVVGGFLVDVWVDKEANRFAFWCALLIPLALVYGAAQLSNLGNELQKNGKEVTAEIEQAGK